MSIDLPFGPTWPVEISVGGKAQVCAQVAYLPRDAGYPRIVAKNGEDYFLLEVCEDASVRLLAGPITVEQAIQTGTELSRGTCPHCSEAGLQNALALGLVAIGVEGRSLAKTQGGVR